MQGGDLKAVRKTLGLTQGQLAAKLGLTGTFIGLMERGEKSIGPRTILALQALLDAKDEEVDEHGFTVRYADRVDGWNVIFTHAGWRGMWGKREVILYGHFRQQRHAVRWAEALERAARPRMQRNLHRIVGALVAAAEQRERVEQAR